MSGVGSIVGEAISSPRRIAPGRQDVDEARRLLAAGREHEAKVILSVCLQESPQDMEAIELLAETAKLSGDWRLHHASLLQLALQFPNSGEIQHRTGLALLQSARLQRAETGGPRSVSTAPARVVVESTRDGLRLLGRAVDLEPRRVEFALDFAGALVDQQQNSAAADVLATAMRRNPGDTSLPVSAARFYEGTGDWRRAIECYDAALLNSPEDLLCLRSRAMCHYRLGNFRQASDDFSLALRRSSVDGQFAEFISWGDACLNSGQLEKACGIFDRIAVNEEFRTADLDVLRGVCRLKLGESGEAEAIVRRALSSWPGHPELVQLAGQLSAFEALSPRIVSEVRPESRLAGGNLSL